MCIKIYRSFAERGCDGEVFELSIACCCYQMRTRSSWVIRCVRGMTRTLEVRVDEQDEVTELRVDDQQAGTGAATGTKATGTKTGTTTKTGGKPTKGTSSGDLGY